MERARVLILVIPAARIRSMWVRSKVQDVFSSRHLWIRTANGPQPDSIPQRPPVTDLFNDRMSPFFASQEMGSILTDRGTEYCSKLETHDYELYLASNGIEHTKIRRVIPRQMASVNASTRPFCKDFISLPSGVYHSLDALQTNLDIWLHEYNMERTHQGKMDCGQTPMQTLPDGKAIWNEKTGQLN